MTKKQLIERLQKLSRVPDNAEIIIIDEDNGKEYSVDAIYPSVFSCDMGEDIFRIFIEKGIER